MPKLGRLEVILAATAIGGVLAFGTAAMLQGIDGALQTTVLGTVIAILVVIVLRKVPGET